MKLIDSIHDPERRILEERRAFRKPCKICLLDFVGASQYFITDFGLIWNRKKCYRNRLGLLTKGYEPLAVLDRAFPYPWTMLDTTSGKEWFPVNQLLGWAFDPQIDRSKKYFVTDTPGIFPRKFNTYEWRESVDPVKVKSNYLTFMNSIYESCSET